MGTHSHYFLLWREFPIACSIGRCSGLPCVKGDPTLPSLDIQDMTQDLGPANQTLLSGNLNIKGVKQRFEDSPEATFGDSVMLWTAVGMHTVLWHDLGCGLYCAFSLDLQCISWTLFSSPPVHPVNYSTSFHSILAYIKSDRVCFCCLLPRVGGCSCIQILRDGPSLCGS